ncbi:MAG: site-2 protease family protein [Oscillospiraceae bacterium]|nr:site-2 protease family protein [Oscillospiraceae bacterium]
MRPISDLQAILDGFDFTYILSLFLSVIPALICITLHELSHGLVAYRLGDTTARDRGRLTLNPLKHLDPMGLLMMLLFRVGLAKPVPVNPSLFKETNWYMSLVALAGPLSNVLITIVFLFLYGVTYLPLSSSGAGQYVTEMIELTARISLGLAVFNLIPVPPLDGSKILMSALPDEDYRKVLRFERYGSLLMLVLVASGVLGRPLSLLINFLYSRLFPIARLGYRMILNLFYL